MTIKLKLTIILFMVVAFSVAILGLTANKAYNDYSVITQAKKLNELSKYLSLLIHETQKERGASAGYIGSKGKKFTSILPKQRVETDTQYKALSEYISSIDLSQFSQELQEEITLFNKDMRRISEMRRSIDSLSISLKD